MSRRKQQTEFSQNAQTILYDCSVDLRIEIPNEDHLNLDWIHKITLSTIAQEFVTKNEKFKGKIDVIYLILKKTLATTKRHWKIFNKNRKVLIKKNRHDAGHIIETGAPGVAYDTIKYCGQVDEDYCNAGGVNVECDVELFLSFGVYGARGVYDEHEFPQSIKNIRRKFENVGEILENWCCEDDGEGFGKTWGRVAEGVREYEDYWESKRLRFRPSPPRDEEDDDSEDDEDVRAQKREAREFFEGLRSFGRKRRRRDDCSVA